MSTQTKECYDSGDLSKIAIIGCNEPSIATGMQIPASDGPEVFIGPDKLPLTDSNFFGAGCAPHNVRTDKRSYFLCSEKELHIGNLEIWKNTLDSAVDSIIRRKHGLAGQFITRLFGLAIYGEGSYGELPPREGQGSPGRIATVLVDLAFTYAGGRTKIYNDSREACFDFQIKSNKGPISILCWFNGSHITIERVRKGFRAFLTYGVFVDMKGPPLTIVPGSGRMAMLEQNVGKLLKDSGFICYSPKRRFLPVLRILVQTYKHTTTPSICNEFYRRIVSCFIGRASAFIASTSHEEPNNSVLSTLREEGEDTIRSLGGESALVRAIAEPAASQLIRITTRLTQL